jgi:hypothetical protein
MPTIIYCQMCFSIPCCLWMLIDAIIGFNQHSHTHILSLCLSATLLSFPIFPFHLKSLLCTCLIINWNTDFTVLGCSHFIGSINTKKHRQCTRAFTHWEPGWDKTPAWPYYIMVLPDWRSSYTIAVHLKHLKLLDLVWCLTREY